MRPSRRAGFSLLHLILLLAVMTILACVAIPGWFSRTDITLNNAVHLLVRDLRDAQDRAAFQHRRLHLRFLASGDGYAVLDSRDQPIEAPVGTGDFVRHYSSDAVFRGVRLEPVLVGDDGDLHFGSRGRTLAASQILVTFRSESQLVEIEETTGEISVDGRRYRAD